MAEAPEHPMSVQADPAVSGPVLGLPGQDSSEPYRPLSLLAIGGFALAVLYAVAVTLGGLAAFAGRFPGPARVLVVLVPLAALLVAAMRGVRQPAALFNFVA